MDIPITLITKPIVSKLISLQSFLFNRPRLDIDIQNNPESLYGKKSLGLSTEQDFSGPIAVPDVKYDLQFYWNYILRIRNNSSKTAYEIKIEGIYLGHEDYLEKMDDIAFLREGETISLKYIIRTTKSMNGRQAEEFLTSFPGHYDEIEIIISYTNEARKKFYTRFMASKELKTNEHLLRKPKKLANINAK